MWREIKGYPLAAFTVCLFAYATAQMDLALFGYAIPAIRELFAPEICHRAIVLFAAQFLFVWAYAGSIFLFPSYLSESRGYDSFDFSLLIGAADLRRQLAERDDRSCA